MSSSDLESTTRSWVLYPQYRADSRSKFIKTTDSNIVIRYLVDLNLVPIGTRPLVGTRRYRTSRMSRIGPVPVARAHDARRPLDAPESWFDSMSRHE